MRKSHKKAWKKWNRFLAGEDLKTKDDEKIEDNPGNDPLKEEFKDKKPQGPIKPSEGKLQSEEETLITKVLQDFIKFLRENCSLVSKAIGWPESDILQVTERTEKEFKVLKGNAKKFGDYTTNILMLLFADNRARLGQGGIKNVSDFIGKIKTLSVETLAPLLGNFQVNVQENGYIGFALNRENAGVINKNNLNKMEEEKVPTEKKEKGKNKTNKSEGKMNIEETKIEEEVKREHVETVRKDLTAKVIEEVPTNSKGRKFEISFERARFEKESFDMYQRYCKDIHEKEKEDPKSYENFLCKQAVEVDKLESGGKVLLLGCYHMKYYVDGKLIAIGVVDIFPQCLSSVYFFYEPEYKNLSLGIIGAIKEIEYVQEMQKYFPSFKYYYLGYYIQDCQKMVYKGEYGPAELLCPYTFNWVTLDDELRKRIDKKETRLSGKNAVLPADLDFSGTNLEKFIKDKIKLDINGPVKLIQLNKNFQNYFLKAFQDISMALGKRMATTFVFNFEQ